MDVEDGKVFDDSKHNIYGDIKRQVQFMQMEVVRGEGEDHNNTLFASRLNLSEVLDTLEKATHPDGYVVLSAPLLPRSWMTKL